MLLLSQAPNLSAKRCSLSSPPLNPKFTNPKPFLFSNRKPKLTATSKPLNLTLAKPEGGIDSSSATKPTTPFHNDQTVFVGQENVPLEGVIQFDKPTLDSSFSSRLNKWGLVFIAKLCSFKKKKKFLDGIFCLMVLGYWVLLFFFSVGLLCLLVGTFWLCFCSLQLEGLVMVLLFLTLRHCARLTLLLLVRFVLFSLLLIC